MSCPNRVSSSASSTEPIPSASACCTNSSNRSDASASDKDNFSIPHDHIIDAGILREVNALQSAGIETFESCQGGPDHAFLEPTVRFHGDRSEGFRALAVAMQVGLPVNSLRRAWPVIDGDPTGPYWELTFRH